VTEVTDARAVRGHSRLPCQPPDNPADFKDIRDELGLSDSALSKQLSTLESAGYVQIRKTFVGKRPRTSASLSAAGRQAFEQHVAALQRMLARSQQNADFGAEAGAPTPTYGLG
jgi:DNA-binding MarR family transcriptional regulator